jgi:hypothetical protein
MKEQWIFLVGNLSKGFEPFGPYDDFDVMSEVHDNEEGWGMQLLPAVKKEETPFGHRNN